MDELPETYHIRQMHPEDLVGSEESLFEFLSGWFGGPQLYMQKKGHPRLRMRHSAYVIGLQARDEWLLCMRQAIDELVADDALRGRLNAAFTDMATHLINTEGAARCTDANGK